MASKVLIVDDSATARMFVKRCVEISRIMDDVEFLEAGDGAEALDLLKEHKVDAVFTDLTMPNVDGEELVKRMKAHPRFFDIPVVVVSSAGSPERKQWLLVEMGVMGIVHKPASPSKLVQIFKNKDKKQSQDGSLAKGE